MLSSFSVYASDESAQLKVSYKTFVVNISKQNWSESLPFGVKALELSEKLYGDTHKNTLTIRDDLGIAYLNHRDYDKAYDIFFKNYEIYTTLYGKDSAKLIPILMDLGRSSREKDNQLKKEHFFKLVKNIAKKEYGKKSEQYGDTVFDVGLKFYQLDQHHKANEYFNDARKAYSRSLGDAVYKTANAILYYGLTSDRGPDSRLSKQLKLSLNYFKDKNEEKEKQLRILLVRKGDILSSDDETLNHLNKISLINIKNGNNPVELVASKKAYAPNKLMDETGKGHVLLEFSVGGDGFAKDISIVENTLNEKFLEWATKIQEYSRYSPAIIGDDVREIRLTRKLEFSNYCHEGLCISMFDLEKNGGLDYIGLNGKTFNIDTEHKRSKFYNTTEALRHN